MEAIQVRLPFSPADISSDDSQQLIGDPAHTPYLRLLKAWRNGMVYGAKVRFPHALVMVFLFRSGTIREKLATILTATRTHATNLGLFAFIYKSTLLVLSRSPKSSLSSAAIPRSSHTFLAGLLGGYLVFGRGRAGANPINQQIVIYIFARVVLALAKLTVRARPESLSGAISSSSSSNGIVNGKTAELWKGRIRSTAWPVFASLSWATVMWLFESEREVLQGSLRRSMVYIYKDSEHWDGLRTLLWHNT